MTYKDYAETIKGSLTARQVAEAIGMEPDRNGFCRCPFHGEKTASLKLYPGKRGWHCFGCGAGGSVIDLVMSYYSMDFKGAVDFLNNEFRLGLPIGYTPTAEQEAEARRRAEEREKKEAERQRRESEKAMAYQRYLEVSAEIAESENNIREYAPKGFDDDFDGRYMEAIGKIDALREEAADLELIIYRKEECE